VISYQGDILVSKLAFQMQLASLHHGVRVANQVEFVKWCYYCNKVGLYTLNEVDP
jgi:acyl-CoA thioesterase